ncbi:MAG TPA: PEP-CTERM sorting domain-containing protein [Stellaceae bacterium]|nr:PEP-CTERM sorting domain-containing protein [Stellaceae bacterium]
MHGKLIIAATGVATLLLTSGIAIAGPAPAAVPEPASLTLMAGGIGVLALVRRFRKKK